MVGFRPLEFPTLPSLFDQLDEEGVGVISLSTDSIRELLTDAGVLREPDYRDQLLQMIMRKPC